MDNAAASNLYFDVMREALRGEWNAIINFYNLQQVEVVEPSSCNNIDIEDENSNVLVSNVTGDTILHLCAQCRRTDVMRQLLRVMPGAEALLLVTNRKGNTVLHEAARTGIVEMAKLILEKESDGGGDPKLISVPNLNGETPIYWAAMYGHKDMLLFLNTTATSREITSTSASTSMVGPLTMRTDGSTILHAAVLAQAYDVAMEIMELYPELASKRNGDDATASHLLALSPSSFKSGTMFARQYLGATPFVLAEYAAAIVYALIEIENYETHNNAATHKTMKPGSSFKEKLKYYFRWLCKGFPVLKLIYNVKLNHSYAIQLLRKLLEKDCGQWTMSHGDPPHEWNDKHNYIENQHPLTITTRVTTYKIRERPIILATKLGIVEMLREIIKVYPESIEFCDEEAGRNLLHLAAEYRHESIIDFLKSSSTNSKRNLDMLVVGIDRDGNTPLHSAAKIGKHKQWHIRGEAQWMQWECVWFQRVKRLLPPHMLSKKNYNNQYAYQVFTETHTDLREKGERWLKEGSNNCMLISALIATVMFASAFTAPGGNNSESGRPVLLRNQDFGPFLHYVGLSLFFSLISLGLFLSIHASPFNEHDFYFRLPLRSVFAITALFNSVTFTVCAFFQTWMLITGWTLFSLGLTLFDIGLGGLGVLFFAELYVDIIVGFVRYLIDILFI
ncbi:hypothetical protein MKW94_012987 [Papaver nudicaule]|uniref:PGG domain-containing protein n=1 Tax=Papaver nudicaule TaxID=74823 RepID=A0AA41V593_PAPNU|nr:hypothetical protein [Papaver nudicaule]